VLPCRFGFPPRTSSHAVGPALEELWLPLPSPKLGSVATPSLTPALIPASVTEDSRIERPSHEVLAPTARQTSRSDCRLTPLFPWMPATRRVCLTRLRYAFRFSQPLDVLFLSKPLQPCFVLVALVGFCLRRIPLPSSCAAVSAPLDASSSASPSAGSPSVFPPLVPVQGFGHLKSPLPRPVLPGARDPCLPWRFASPRVHPSVLGPALLNAVTNRRPFSRKPLLMGLV
jgi:hypothetical protein